MTRSPLLNFILGSVFGFAIAAMLVFMHGHQFGPAPAAPAVVATLETQAQCARDYNGEDEEVVVTQERWDTAKKALMNLIVLYQKATADLKEARENPAAQELARSGHVMNETQCRAWMGVFPAQQPAASISTVLYEAGRASVNISLLPLPGAPRIAVGPGSQLAPRWILPGRIQPQMIGETRQATYYYFDAQSSQWQGPFQPERVVQ